MSEVALIYVRALIVRVVVGHAGLRPPL